MDDNVILSVEIQVKKWRMYKDFSYDSSVGLHYTKTCLCITLNISNETGLTYCVWFFLYFDVVSYHSKTLAKKKLRIIHWQFEVYIHFLSLKDIGIKYSYLVICNNLTYFETETLLTLLL